MPTARSTFSIGGSESIDRNKVSHALRESSFSESRSTMKLPSTTGKFAANSCFTFVSLSWASWTALAASAFCFASLASFAASAVALATSAVASSSLA